MLKLAMNMINEYRFKPKFHDLRLDGAVACGWHPSPFDANVLFIHFP